MILPRNRAEKILGHRLDGFDDARWSYYDVSASGKLLGGPYTSAEAKRLEPELNPRKRLYIYPNESARAKAKSALERRRLLPKSKRGGLDAAEAHAAGIGSGVLRARDIASGKRIDAYRVKAFFDRHRTNYLNAKVARKNWNDSKALQAWDLWGGEPLRKQVEAAVKKDKK